MSEIRGPESGKALSADQFPPVDQARFWAFVQKADGDACWLWQSVIRKDDGYGIFTKLGSQKQTMSHRVAYALTKGPVARGKLVRHTCDNPPCCRPDHLLI